MDDAVGGQMPAVFGGVGRDALEQPMVIPAEGEEDVPGAFHGDRRRVQKGIVIKRHNVTSGRELSKEGRVRLKSFCLIGYAQSMSHA